jgi:hypothetical protein
MSVHPFPAPALRLRPTSPSGDYGYPEPDREPEPAFHVDRRNGCVLWTISGGYEIRLIHAPQFRKLAAIFADNGWFRNFNALLDAELVLSAPEPMGAA